MCVGGVWSLGRMAGDASGTSPRQRSKMPLAQSPPAGMHLRRRDCGARADSQPFPFARFILIYISFVSSKDDCARSGKDAQGHEAGMEH